MVNIGSYILTIYIYIESWSIGRTHRRQADLTLAACGKGARLGRQGIIGSQWCWGFLKWAIPKWMVSKVKSQNTMDGLGVPPVYGHPLFCGWLVVMMEITAMHIPKCDAFPLISSMSIHLYFFQWKDIVWWIWCFLCVGGFGISPCCSAFPASQLFRSKGFSACPILYFSSLLLAILLLPKKH